MLSLRVAILLLWMSCPAFSFGQHQPLHWYAFQSIVPLNAEAGKEALQLLRSNTPDSLSTFNDKNDYFSLATSEEVNLNELAEILNEAGFFLIDVTNNKLENHYNVRMSKGYQYAKLFCLNEELFETESPSQVIITPEIRNLLSPGDLERIQTSAIFIIKED